MSANLIMFGEDWGAYPSSTQHLARALVSDRKILWVNSIGLRRPRFNRHDIERLGHKLVNAVRQLSNPVGGEAPPPGLTVAAPLVLPFPGNPTCRTNQPRNSGAPTATDHAAVAH